MAHKSLKKTIFVRLLVPVVCFLLLETILSYEVTLHYVNKAYDRWLLDSVHSLEQEIKIKDQEIYVELSTNELEIFRWDDLDKTYFKIIAETQGVLAGDIFLPEPEAYHADWSNPVYFNAEIYNQPVRVVSILVQNQRTPEKVFIHVAETINKRREMMADILLADLIPQLLLVVLVSVYLFTSINRGLWPLNQLAKQIACRSPRDLSPIVDADIYLEVKTLTETINQLFERLNSVIASQQRFIANAAHQLRTPLAGLKLQAGVAQRENNLDAMRPALSQIQSSADRMSHLITQLLILARSEQIEGRYKLKQIDLRKLVRDVCIERVPKALLKQIDLSFDAPEQAVFVQGDALLLMELLGNLIDNAISYGAVNGKVAVKLIAGPQPSLHVQDDGIGIPDSERDRIFERFYRISDSSSDGCGLGLSIVKEIADLHQARVQVVNKPDARGTEMRVIFP